MDWMVPLAVGALSFFLVTPKGTHILDGLVKKIEQRFDDKMLKKLEGKPIVFDD